MDARITNTFRRENEFAFDLGEANGWKLLLVQTLLIMFNTRALLWCDFLAMPYEYSSLDSRSTELVVFSLMAGEFVTIAWLFFLFGKTHSLFLNIQLAGQLNIVSKLCPMGKSHGSVLCSLTSRAHLLPYKLVMFLFLRSEEWTQRWSLDVFNEVLAIFVTG